MNFDLLIITFLLEIQASPLIRVFWDKGAQPIIQCRTILIRTTTDRYSNSNNKHLKNRLLHRQVPTSKRSTETQIN